MSKTDSTSRLHKLGKPQRASTSKLNTVEWNQINDTVGECATDNLT